MRGAAAVRLRPAVRRVALGGGVLASLLAAATPAAATATAPRAAMAVVVTVTVSAGSARTTTMRA